MIQQNTLPNKYCILVCVYGTCSHSICFAEKPISTQHVSYTVSIMDNFLHVVFALFSLSRIDIADLAQQLLVCKEKR